MKLHSGLLLLAATLCSNPATAQGIFQFNWCRHTVGGPPAPGLIFQASFQVYDYEMAPGTQLAGSELFRHTLTVTSPDRTFTFPLDGSEIFSYHGQPYPPPYSGSYVNGDMTLDLVLGATWADASSPDIVIDVSGATIGETVAGHLGYSESGFWAFAPVPEPSCGALLVLGVLALIGRGGRWTRLVRVSR
jgi:hypothetical protein